MSTNETIIHLSQDDFSTQERKLVEHGPLIASTFRFPSGVCAPDGGSKKVRSRSPPKDSPISYILRIDFFLRRMSFHPAYV